ncbi:hypothetical protein [uncultured Tateyamaria sp.]|uniref:hypothetical protein n=1 Tax=uncultured Tateyamaria sp. TaxID=455651 RepID=UPI002608B099|nr:hypothetical protein [uncultured Tateyamaria sp.]
MLWVVAGLTAPIVLSALLAAFVGARMQSVLLGLVAGVIGFAATFATSVGLMLIWLRARLIAFVETEIPLILNRLSELFGQIAPLKETL